MKRERVQVAGVGEDDGLGRWIRRERGDRGAQQASSCRIQPQ
jgi:hypothetical protein